MKKIYVACPYSNGDKEANVAKAIDTAELLSKKGWCPYIPTLTHFWDKLYSHPYEFWVEQDNEWLPYCDALFRIEGESSGADKEIEYAKMFGLKIYYNIDDVPEV